MGHATEYYDDLSRRLYTAVLSDALDSLGYRNQVCRPGLRRVAGGEILVGRAATMLAGSELDSPSAPYDEQINAIDALTTGDVVVASTQGSIEAAFWGELFSTAAQARGARGVVVDGLVRDTRKINDMGFTVFASGTRPIDSLGRLTVYRWGVPISCRGVRVEQGDLVFADHDGVVIVPARLEDEVVGRALEKVSKENEVRTALRSGSTLRAAWDKHHVL